MSDKKSQHFYDGSSSYKERVEAFGIDYATQLEYIPSDLFQVFPKLEGLTFWDTKLPTIKDGFFNKELAGIKRIYIGRCSVEKIEGKAFENLPKLKWINMEDNKISHLDNIIFWDNPKLEFVSFYKNNILSIHPRFFDRLHNLVEIRSSKEHCEDLQEGCSNCQSPFDIKDYGECIFAQYQNDLGYDDNYDERFGATMMSKGNKMRNLPAWSVLITISLLWTSKLM